MSMHKTPLTEIERAGLQAHGLDIGTPSQLSDVFRQGVAWAQDYAILHPSAAEKSEPVVITDNALREFWRSKGGDFHGPFIETGAMPESKLLPFLRELMRAAPRGADASNADLYKAALEKITQDCTARKAVMIACKALGIPTPADKKWVARLADADNKQHDPWYTDPDAPAGTRGLEALTKLQQDKKP